MRACKIRSHAPHVPVPDKETAMRLWFRLSFVGSSYHLSTVFVTEVLSWLTADKWNGRSSSLHMYDQFRGSAALALCTLA